MATGVTEANASSDSFLGNRWRFRRNGHHRRSCFSISQFSRSIRRVIDRCSQFANGSASTCSSQDTREADVEKTIAKRFNDQIAVIRRL
ncbi:hypothetical protein B2M20_15400 [Nitrobacter vulgaris]|uniref:Uncharacterized protein n=1 Tax=Nitrobacter vulgaris TaxID=29421 RepID=A0A1V4HV50_NITVU|nr:hypothetical protein B2M20_15400 [Nitrobacter vulgaris]